MRNATPSLIHEKIFFEYEDQEGNPGTESMWAINRGDNEFCVGNIPFYVSGYALGDLVLVEHRDGVPYVKSLVEESGNSTIQIIFFDIKHVAWARTYLNNFNCESEISEHPTYISVNIPYNVDYSFIKGYLKKGEAEGKWSYKEACLAHKI
jgi:hypothetical protein